jgi:1-acyl-sn-glycerol-3-phosphate acyltransferase
MTTLRALLYNLGFWLMTAVLAIFCLPALAIGRRAVVRVSEVWTRAAFAWLRLTVGLDHELRGAGNLPSGPAIVALKHQSAWDTLYLNQLLRDPAVVLKQELLWLPLVGLYFRACGMIPIDRKGGARALKQMLAASERARDAGRPIAIFPEGTRGPVGRQLPFHPGVAALYARLGLPLVPVALNSGLYWGRNAFLKRPGKVLVEVLPPIPPGLDRRQAIRLLEERIQAATDRLVAEGRGAATPLTDPASGTNIERTDPRKEPA